MHLRPWLALVALVSTPALAQNLDPSRIYPVTVPIRDAGTLDLGTGRWQRGGGSSDSGSTIVFNNTCNSTTGGFYYGMEHCEEVYGSGRIPSTSDPSAPAGASDENLIDSYTIGYCTGFPTGAVDIEIGFIEQATGCVDPRGKAPTGAELAYFDLSGTGLPGDNAGGGNLSCWTVTVNVANGGFLMRSDGDSSWDNDASQDDFNWIFSHGMNNATFGVSSGPFVAGDPSVASFGACSYSLACGVDPIDGSACGTGLAAQDQFWLNADGSGGSSYPPISCPLAASAGSNCYSFGGWPRNPYASFYLQMTSAESCATGSPSIYCTAAQNPSISGCLASISAPSCDPIPGAADYALELSISERGVPAMLIYSTLGRATIPFGTGQLCIQPPMGKGPVFGTGGIVTCGGTGSVLVNDPMGIDFPPGTTAQFQYLILVPGVPFQMDLSDAVELVY